MIIYIKTSEIFKICFGYEVWPYYNLDFCSYEQLFSLFSLKKKKKNKVGIRAIKRGIYLKKNRLR